MLLPLAIDAQSLSCQEFRQERFFVCTNCSGYSPHVYNELHATSRSRWSRNTPGQGNRIALTCSKNALDAESVSCTENTFKQHECHVVHVRHRVFESAPLLVGFQIRSPWCRNAAPLPMLKPCSFHALRINFVQVVLFSRPACHLVKICTGSPKGKI